MRTRNKENRVNVRTFLTEFDGENGPTSKMFDQLRIFIEKFDSMDWSVQRDMTNSLTFLWKDQILALGASMN